MCKFEGGQFKDNIETTAIDFFDQDKIPYNLATEKCTKEQIDMCFEAYRNPALPTSFD